MGSYKLMDLVQGTDDAKELCIDFCTLKCLDVKNVGDYNLAVHLIDNSARYVFKWHECFRHAGPSPLTEQNNT
jgi:hypothetical protein